MKRWMLAAAVLGILTGCQTTDQKALREQSIKRWYTARAEVLCGLGREHLKVGQLDSAAKVGREALALEANCVNAHVLLGKVYIEQGLYAQAESELRAAAELQSSSAEIHYLLGVAQEKAGEMEEALASYRRSLELDSSYTDAILAIGEVLAETDKVEEALAYAETNMKVAGNQPGIYELAGRLATMLKDYGKAEKYYQLATDLDYGNPYYLDALAQSQFMAGHADRAQETLRKLVAIPGHGNRASVHVRLGDCLLATGRAAEARDEYLCAGELAPDNAAAWTGLTRAYLALSDVNRASLAAKEALKADGLNSEASMVLGYALLRSGQIAQAISVLSRAASAHPNDAMLICLLGRAHAAAGNTDQARKCYDAALKLEPGNQLAKTLLAGGEQRAAPTE